MIAKVCGTGPYVPERFGVMQSGDIIAAMASRAGIWTWCCVLCSSPLLRGASTTPKELRLPQPAVRSLFPLGGKAGRVVKVAIEGEFLDRASLVRCECTDV